MLDNGFLYPHTIFHAGKQGPVSLLLKNDLSGLLDQRNAVEVASSESRSLECSSSKSDLHAVRDSSLYQSSVQVFQPATLTELPVSYELQKPSASAAQSTEALRSLHLDRPSTPAAGRS